MPQPRRITARSASHAPDGRRSPGATSLVPGEGAERNVEWVRRAWAQLEPLTRGRYVNIADRDPRDSRAHAAYDDTNIQPA